MTLGDRAKPASDCFNGWADYPDIVDGHNGVFPAAPALNQQLARMSQQLFSATEDIWTIGIADDGMSVLLRKA